MDQQVNALYLCMICQFNYLKVCPLVTAGCGKSHFIKQQMKKSSYSVIVAINEGFQPQKAIKRLHVLPKNERNCGIFFNFHLIPPVGVSLSVR